MLNRAWYLCDQEASLNPTQGGWVIFLTLLVAMVFGTFHLPATWPEWLSMIRPNWLLVVLFFWLIEVPHRIGLIGTWILGLMVDVLLAQPLGLSGLILASITSVTWRFYDRLRMYSALQQSGVVFVIVGLAEIFRVMVISLDSERAFGFELLTIPAMSMLAWPIIYLLLIRLRTGMRIE